MTQKKELEPLVTKYLKEKDSLTKRELDKLNKNKDLWRDILLDMKSGCERQFTSRRATAFKNYQSYKLGQMNEEKWLEEQNKHLIWQADANTFLSQIETNLRALKNDGKNTIRNQAH